MATNKHAVIRYEALDKCLSNRGKKFFIEGLIDYVARALDEHTGLKSNISRRQIYNDMAFMKSEAGYKAPIESFLEGRKTFYRYSIADYSINNQPINAMEAEQLNNALEILSRFKGIPQFEFIPELSLKLQKSFQLKTSADFCVQFDHNEYLKNLDALGAIQNHIQHKNALKIGYKAFQQAQEEVFVFFPYLLKQYNKRWFIFGKRIDFEGLTNLALDRIVSFEVADKPFVNCTVNMDEYFEDIIGVSRPIDKDCEQIALKVSAVLWPYVESKPIHPSQKVLNRDKNAVTIGLELIPNYEFYAQILGFGEHIEILSPPLVRGFLKEKIEAMKENYI